MDLLSSLYGDRYMFCVKSIERYYFYTWFYCWHHSPWLNTIDIGSWRVHYDSSCVSPPACFFLLGCVCNGPPSYCLFCFCFTRIQVKMLFLSCPSFQHKFQHLFVFIPFYIIFWFQFASLLNNWRCESIYISISGREKVREGRKLWWYTKITSF